MWLTDSPLAAMCVGFSSATRVKLNVEGVIITPTMLCLFLVSSTAEANDGPKGNKDAFACGAERAVQVPPQHHHPGPTTRGVAGDACARRISDVKA